MTAYDVKMLRALVEPTRVHKRLYTDPEIFNLEMERIWGRAWIYIGHESQVPEPGDFITTMLGAQPVIMVRDGASGEIYVLYNRCPHKGAQIATKPCGKVKGFRCPYHGWSFKTNGSLLAVPHKAGYEDTGFDPIDPQFSMKKVASVESYRGFVFARLAKQGEDLKTFLGPAAATIDNVIDRSPEGEIEIAGGRLPYLHDNNWKMFVENLNDAMHPMVAHAAVGAACRKHVSQFEKDAPPPAEAEIIFPFGSSYEFFDKMGVTTLNRGHSFMGGQMSIHSSYADIPGYFEAMIDAYGEEKAKEILSSNRHNTTCYPSFTIKDAVQVIRVVRPISVNQTLIESWTFRLKGAPEELFRRTIRYSRLINSPGSLVGPDDWDCYARMQSGLSSDGGDWIDLGRYMNKDEEDNIGTRSPGTSDISMRNQFSAWIDYMTSSGKTSGALS